MNIIFHRFFHHDARQDLSLLQLRLPRAGDELPDRLEAVCGRSEATDALLKDAVRATDQEVRPQVLIIIAARFQRLSWKYESMAYNIILKNVGVLYQTMYLVATAMDLAPCALGGGDSDLFARAAGLDYYAETSVGEFLLGSKRI